MFLTSNHEQSDDSPRERRVTTMRSPPTDAWWNADRSLPLTSTWRLSPLRSDASTAHLDPSSALAEG